MANRGAWCKRLATLAGFAVSFSGLSAHAKDEAKPRERSGLAVGLHVGGALGDMQGYPNDLTKIDRPEYLANSGAAGGFYGGGWLGVAMSDALVFGLSGAGSFLGAQNSRSYAWLAGLHVGVLSFHGVLGGSRWARPLALELDVGLGRSQSQSNSGDAVLADTGVASHLRTGLSYELLQLGAFRMGPMLSADFVFSPSARRSLLILGFSTSFYSGGQRRQPSVDPG